MMKQRVWMKRATLISMAMVALAGCSDWRDGVPDEDTRSQNASREMTFATTVATSRGETRADGSIVNKNETWLPESKERTYKTVKLDNNGNPLFANGVMQLEDVKNTFYAGVFAANTGTDEWKTLDANESGSQASANLLYNQRMSIAKASDGVNALEYYPKAADAEEGETPAAVRFWPNDESKVSFWAYYPWNPTDDPGEYGVAIWPKVSSDNYGVKDGNGMGSIKFTMHPDASQQNDFLISDLVADKTKSDYPLVSTDNGQQPKPVQFRLHHMLAQVRLYAFIRGNDRIVWQTTTEGTETVTRRVTDTELAAWTKDVQGTSREEGEGKPEKWADAGAGGYTKDTLGVKLPAIYNLYGTLVTLKEGDPLPDETQCVRWDRSGGTWDVTHTRQRANITYSMSFNNIKTTATFTPTATYDEATKTYKTAFPYTPGTGLGSATVYHYIMNPYWFRFDKSTGERYMLNDDYMYGKFEDMAGFKAGGMTDDEDSKAYEQDGQHWKTYNGGKSNAMGYALNKENRYFEGEDVRDNSKGENDEDRYYHYNYAPGNILMVVPQVLNDEDVPHVVITAQGYDTKGTWREAYLTINMLNMGLKWESGFIYSYAFVGELDPLDDIVKGPQSVTVVFDPTKQTDQW